MSELPAIDPHRVKAMELAVQAGGSNAELVERAKAIHSFLSGSAAPKAAPAAGTKTTETAPAAGTKTTEAKPATAAKAAPAAGTKTPAPAKAGAAAPKAAAADAPPAGDTKDANGNNTFDDVKAALLAVMLAVPGDNGKHDKGRKLAYEILAAKGGGVKAVRDLKPGLYDSVVAACTEAAKKIAAAPKAAATKPAAAAPKVAAAAAVVEDDLGVAVDTSGANAETAGDDDPPEGGSGEDL